MSDSDSGWGSPTRPFISYAQNYEDVMLKRVFSRTDPGFYIDIGAYHPVEGSVTKAFYDRGWSGINIEPGSVFDELVAARPRDVNLKIAVSDRAGEVAFIENTADRGMSRVSRDLASSPAEGELRMVPCDTLDAIVERHCGERPVDFLKIDAEGSEGAIVHSTDWLKFRPRVLLLEATLPWSNTLNNHHWEPILLRQGFLFVFFDGINCFYLREEDAGLVHHFKIPVNVLDWVSKYGGPGPPPTVPERTDEPMLDRSDPAAPRTAAPPYPLSAAELQEGTAALRNLIDIVAKRLNQTLDRAEREHHH